MSEDPDVLQEDFTLLVRAPDAPLPITVHGAQWYPTALSVAAALLFIALLWIWGRRFSRRPEPGERIDRIALKELERWQGLYEAQRYREAVLAISATSRRYVEGRFGLRAPTLTTEEFWAFQRSAKSIPQPHLPFFERFLAGTDVIKYAGYRPDAGQFNELLTSAIEFVRSSCNNGRARS